MANSSVHPRFAFVTWLVMMKRIRVRRWLYDHGLVDNDDCPMCAMGVESIDGLFFSCPFATEVIAGVLDHVQLKTCAKTFEEWWIWVLKISRGKSDNAVMRRRLVAALVYEIWRVRNVRIFKLKAVRKEKCGASILMMLRMFNHKSTMEKSVIVTQPRIPHLTDVVYW
ncbi:hypothetical protein AKJ16_DCAP05019 [Drosera capensis]